MYSFKKWPPSNRLIPPLRIPCVHVVEKKIQTFVFILELDMIVLTYPYLLHTK